jgi:hypothetical protein
LRFDIPPGRSIALEGYFLMADILGFSKIIENTKDVELDSRIGSWVTLVEALAKEYDIHSLQLLSDTVFAGTNSTQTGLRSLIAFGRSLLQKGLDASFPVRGAISHGSYEFGRLTYGKVVIKCHKIENAQEWMGIGCDANLPHGEGEWGLDSLVCYPVPMKSGPIVLMPTVAWVVPDYKTLAGKLTGNGLTKKDDKLPWEWATKVKNTVEYGLYLRILACNNVKPSQFYGTLPIETFEMNLFARK